MKRNRIVTVGIDPGFADIGLVALHKDSKTKMVDVVDAAVVSTKRASKKQLRSLRVSVDNANRMEILWDGVFRFVEKHRPGMVGMEDYNAYKAQSSSSQKTLAAFGIAFAVCRCLGAHVQPFLPQDLKRAFTLSMGASKKDVEDALCQKMDSLGGFLDSVCKGRREHIADAAGHAYLAMISANQIALITGAERPHAVVPV